MKKFILIVFVLFIPLLLISCNNGDEFTEKERERNIIETTSKPGLEVDDEYSTTDTASYGDLH